MPRCGCSNVACFLKRFSPQGRGLEGPYQLIYPRDSKCVCYIWDRYKCVNDGRQRSSAVPDECGLQVMNFTTCSDVCVCIYTLLSYMYTLKCLERVQFCDVVVTPLYDSFFFDCFYECACVCKTVPISTST